VEIQLKFILPQNQMESADSTVKRNEFENQESNPDPEESKQTKSNGLIITSTTKPITRGKLHLINVIGFFGSIQTYFFISFQ